jgi:hypothetical protein
MFPQNTKAAGHVAELPTETHCFILWLTFLQQVNEMQVGIHRGNPVDYSHLSHVDQAHLEDALAARASSTTCCAFSSPSDSGFLGKRLERWLNVPQSGLTCYSLPIKGNGSGAMRSFRSKMFSSIALLLPHAALADLQPLTAEIVEESFDPIWPVSGHVIVGAMGHLSVHPQPSLLLFVGRQEDVRICAEITSRSWNYLARLAISQDALPRAGGVVPVLELTQNPDTLTGLAGHDLAVRASQGNCGAPTEPRTAPGEPGTSQLFIAGWGNQAEFSGPEDARLPDAVRPW